MEESMDNILQTQDLCTYEESSSVFWSLYKGVDSTRPCPTGEVWIRLGQNWSETRCCSGRSSTHQQRKRRSGFVTQTPKSLRYKHRKGWWKFNLSFCFLKVILFYCIILIFTEMARKFVNPLSLRIFYLILSGDDSLNNHTNYNTRLKLLQPEIYPGRYM